MIDDDKTSSGADGVAAYERGFKDGVFVGREIGGVAQAPQEPVAWLYESWNGGDSWGKHFSFNKPTEKWQRNIVPLYPTGAAQTPQGDWHDGYREGMRDAKNIRETFGPAQAQSNPLAVSDRDKPHPNPDGFINDYD